MNSETNELTVALNKKDGPVFIGDIPQLEKQLTKTNKKRPIIGGQLLIVSLEPLKSQPGFVLQAPRKISGKLFDTSKKEQFLHLAVDKDALDLLVKGKQKPAFFVDGMLKFGLRLKGSDEHCVIGAFAGTTSTQVLVMVFKKQKLINYNEYQLAAPSLNTYEADLQLLLERLVQSNSGAQFHWCGPLSKPKLTRIIESPVQVWSLAPVQSLNLAGKPPFARVHGVPLLIVFLSIAAYSLAAYLPYKKYQDARYELQQESASLGGEKAFSLDRLNKLRSRQGFFEKQSAKVARYEKFLELVKIFGQIPKLSVESATLFSSPEAAKSKAGNSSRPVGFEFKVSVPQNKSYDSALDQGNALLTELSMRAGIELRVSVGGGGIIESNGSRAESLSITYTIQGEL